MDSIAPQTAHTPSPSAQTSVYPLVFHGKATDYFGIWIVNVLLSILTLGIYSAWAKVRNKKFFLGNTVMDNHSFDYHADPKKILIGRMIAAAIFGVYFIVGQVFPLISFLIIIPLWLILPWMIKKSLAFNAKMTSYRNVRFHFTGGYLGALRAFIIMPIIGALPFILFVLPSYLVWAIEMQKKRRPTQTSLDLPAYITDYASALLPYIWPLVGFSVLFFIFFIPLATRSRLNYVINNHQYGQGLFVADLRIGGFIKALGWSLLPVLLLLAPLLILSSTSISLWMSGHTIKPMVPGMSQTLGIIYALILYLSLFLIPYIYRSRVQNHAVGTMVLDKKHRFYSTLSGLKLVWIIVSNLVVSSITFLLMRPWAICRTTRYKTSVLGMVTNASLDDYVSQEINSQGVGAEELMDMGEFDFGF